MSGSQERREAIPRRLNNLEDWHLMKASCRLRDPDAAKRRIGGHPRAAYGTCVVSPPLVVARSESTRMSPVALSVCTEPSQNTKLMTPPAP